MNKGYTQPEVITLMARSETLPVCKSLLEQADVDLYAIYGGAIRDPDHGAANGQDIKVNDFDTRVWVDNEHYLENVFALREKFAAIAGVQVHDLKVFTPHKQRFEVVQGDLKMDVSVRGMLKEKLVLASSFSVAVDRARDSDLGISAVAMDREGTAVAMPEYLKDRANKTITVYGGEGYERAVEYARRLQREKFQSYRIMLPE